MSHVRLLAVLVLIAGSLALRSLAEEPKKAEASGQTMKLESKQESYTPATTIAFGKELGLPFDSLDTLGTRIEQARKAADPVGLMSAASELTIAEQVSDNKKAALTGETLTKEAIELAKARNLSAELKAIALATTDKTIRTELEALAAKAKKAEDSRAAAVKAGEVSKGIFRELVVYNNTGHHLHVYVDGRYVGHVDGYSHEHFNVHTHGETILDARGGGHRWHRHVHGDYNRYEWTLNH